MKRYSDDQIDAAMLEAMEKANALELDEERRAFQAREIQEMREGVGRYGDKVRDAMRLHLRLFLESIHQMTPARPGTPEERQQRIRDRIEARQEKRAKKGRRS